MSCRPYPLAGNRPTGAVRGNPSSAVFLCGNSPWKMLHRHTPPAPGGSSPQTYGLRSSPPRAANSHSASVGSRFPAHLQYASASCQQTWTTGWSSRPLRSLSGPSGCFQHAPGTHFHQFATLSHETASLGGTKTRAPGTSCSSVGGGAPGGRPRSIDSLVGLRSATVTYPVSATNRANAALVTSVLSIQNPDTDTLWTGWASAKCGPSSSVPIQNVPPGTHTI